MTLLRSLVLMSTVWLLSTSTVVAQRGEWRSYGADVASSKYSPLDQITGANAGDLQIVWRQSTIPQAVRQGSSVRAPAVVQNTPLMAEGRLYVSTALGTVAALDAATGEVVWFDPLPEGVGRRGGASRGVAYWSDSTSDDARVIAVVGSTLVALNARTGTRYDDFGDGGEVDLTQGYDTRSVSEFVWRSAPLVVNDVVVVGSANTDFVNETMPARKEMAPGDVRGFNVRTGEQLWIFHTVPQEGEVGNDTWLTGPNEDRASWEYTGNTNMWAWPSADEELGDGVAVCVCQHRFGLFSRSLVLFAGQHQGRAGDFCYGLGQWLVARRQHLVDQRIDPWVVVAHPSPNFLDHIGLADGEAWREPAFQRHLDRRDMAFAFGELGERC